MRRLVDDGHAQHITHVWPTDVPGFKTDHPHTDAELALILAAVVQVEAEQGYPFTDDDRTLDTPTHLHRRPQDDTPAAETPPIIDEGARIDDNTYNALKQAYGSLTDAADERLTAVLTEAETAGYTLSLVAHRSVRRYEIARALIWWARSDLTDNDLAGLLSCVLDAPVSGPNGAVIGTLTIDQAVRLAEMTAAAVDN